MKNNCCGCRFSDCVKDVALPLLWTLPYLSRAGVVLCWRRAGLKLRKGHNHEINP